MRTPTFEDLVQDLLDLSVRRLPARVVTDEPRHHAVHQRQHNDQHIINHRAASSRMLAFWTTHAEYRAGKPSRRLHQSKEVRRGPGPPTTTNSLLVTSPSQVLHHDRSRIVVVALRLQDPLYVLLNRPHRHHREH